MTNWRGRERKSINQFNQISLQKPKSSFLCISNGTSGIEDAFKA